MITRAGWIMDGWFKAPETGKYRFYIACDDVCHLNLDKDHPYGTEGSDITNDDLNQVCYRTSWTSWRNYYDEAGKENHKQISDWIDLEKGEFYPMLGYTIEGGGHDNYAIAVEFEKANTEGHHHSNREIQVLSIEHENRGESWSCTVENIDDGTFKLQFLNPKTEPPSYYLTEEIKADGNSNHFQNRVKDYYWQNFRSGVTVTKVLEDTAAGPETKATYTITMTKPIDGYSMSSLSVVAVTTNATISVNPPMTHTPSSTPLSGSYIVTCPDPENPAVSYSTPEIDVFYWTQGVDRFIQNYIPFLSFKTYVQDLRSFGYRENGFRYAIFFQDYEGDVPQCTISSGIDDPIRAENPVFISETLQNYGSNLFFDPVPLEMLYTPATRPQVQVTVDDLPAVCPHFNCGFAYVEAVGEVTSQTLDGRNMEIKGIDLPTANFRVELAGADCEDIEIQILVEEERSPNATEIGTESTITCKLSHQPAAGNWDAKLITEMGTVPMGASVNPITVTLSTRSISPSINLN